MKSVLVTAVLFTTTALADAPSQRGVVCRPDSQAILLPEMPEASGVAIRSGAPTRLWIINDSGPPVLFSVALNGQVTDRVRVTGAELENWEDLAAGPCGNGRCLYIADVGDNRGIRSKITIYRVPEPAPGETSTKPAEAFHARYPDAAQDAESIFVDARGMVFIITKGRAAKIYRLRPGAPGTITTLEAMGALANPSTVSGKGKPRAEPATGAAMSSDGAWVVVRSNRAVEFFQSAAFLTGKPGAPLPLDLSNLREPQGEGIAMGASGAVFLVSESGGGRVGVLRRLSCTLPQ